MSEHFANLNFPNGESIKVTRDMARLYTHLGNGALFDHVFIVTDEEELKGVYVWAQIPPDNPTYLGLAPAVVENGCELHVNLGKVATNDRTAFEKYAVGEIPDEVPEEWFNEDNS